MNTSDPNPDAIPVVEAFFQSHDAAHFAENGEWVDTAQNITARGRAEIARALRQWYANDFSDARDEPLNLIVTDDTVVAEWTFRGVLHRESGRQVLVPIVAVFEVHDHVIQRARLYYDLARRIGTVDTTGDVGEP